MKKLKNLILSSFLILGVTSSFAKGDHKDMSKNEKLSKKSRAVSGQVVMHKEVKLPGYAKKNMVVMIKTDKGDERLVVDLGNADKFKDKNISKDSKIQAEGRLVRLGNKELLIAKNLKVDGEMIQINRSEEKESFKKSKSS